MVATMLQFFYQSVLPGIEPEIKNTLPQIHIEKYLLILWVMWYALVGSRNYFYKRILLSKE